MFKKLVLMAVIVTAISAVQAFAAPDCQAGSFVGTYTRAIAANDPIGNGELHASLFQLTFHADGTVNQYWTGLPDYMINLGSGGPWIGSWKCRDNGKILVTMMGSTFEPAAPDANIGSVSDIKLYSHFRSTYVFEITNNQTLTRIKARSRTYAADQDPTDPDGGTLGTLSTTPLVYKKLVPSGADLNEP